MRVANRLAFLRSELVRSLAVTFVARAVAAVGNLFLLLVVGRHYGAVGVGVLAMAQSLLLGAGIIAKGGMDGSLMRYVGQHPTNVKALTYLGWAIKPVSVVSFVLFFIILIFRGNLEAIFNAEGLASLLVGFSCSVPFFALAYVLSGFFKGIRKPALASLMENGIVSLVAAIVIYIYFTYFSDSSSMAVIGWAYSFSSAGILVFGILQVIGWWRNAQLQGGGQCATPAAGGYSDVDAQSIEIEEVTRAQFFSTSRAFFATNIAQFMQNVLAIMIAGWMLTSQDLGLFKSAQQVGLLIAFVLMVINAIFPPRFAALFYSGDHAGLTKMARLGSLVGIVFVIPFLLLCLVFPEWVLGWFGAEFAAAKHMLMLIAIGQLVNVATGSVGFLLSMTGHEKLMRNIALACSGAGLLGFYFFIGLYGAMGAAIALTFVLVSQNVIALIYVWIKLGVWTLPVPNFLPYLGVRSQYNERPQ